MALCAASAAFLVAHFLTDDRVQIPNVYVAERATPSVESLADRAVLRDAVSTETANRGSAELLALSKNAHDVASGAPMLPLQEWVQRAREELRTQGPRQVPLPAFPSTPEQREDFIAQILAPQASKVDIGATARIGRLRDRLPSDLSPAERHSADALLSRILELDIGYGLELNSAIIDHVRNGDPSAKLPMLSSKGLVGSISASLAGSMVWGKAVGDSAPFEVQANYALEYARYDRLGVALKTLKKERRAYDQFVSSLRVKAR